MSVSMTHRIARVALLLAASAAPIVAAGGSAVAADQPSGGMSRADGLTDSVDGATKRVGGAAGTAGGQVAEKVAPGTGPVVEDTTKKATKDGVSAKTLPSKDLSSGQLPLR
ncbi:ATP-binding protein [Streptomyces sp. NA04227]|uniref:ATP-binding protein n=1 Tax=Streptomyces sp. NA04227 TaxID=2742136 RepID=UPI001591E5E9|nr:ATP-binding protein [Streptomyces sp. NA04227]QKW08970.1 ATP-binding protein [Streptomyces sp. NA04227]